MFVKLLVILIPLLLLFWWWTAAKRKRQRAFIAAYRFNPSIAKKVGERYPHLSPQQLKRVMEGLREYFQLCNQAKRRMVSMPSQVVDEAWHAFILFTRAYHKFCDEGLGRFLHHTPAEAMAAPTLAQDGIKRAWRIACSRERIDPARPDRLPLLFALDAELGITDGFFYSLDCSRDQEAGITTSYCAGHIGCSSGCAGDSGAPDSGGSDAGADGGCGGGCGGD